MRMIGKNRIELDLGETVPVLCKTCRNIYPPKANSLASKCPTCGTLTIHDEQKWTKIEPEKGVVK